MWKIWRGEIQTVTYLYIKSLTLFYTGKDILHLGLSQLGFSFGHFIGYLTIIIHVIENCNLFSLLFACFPFGSLVNPGTLADSLNKINILLKPFKLLPVLVYKYINNVTIR